MPPNKIRPAGPDTITKGSHEPNILHEVIHTQHPATRVIEMSHVSLPRLLSYPQHLSPNIHSLPWDWVEKHNNRRGGGVATHSTSDFWPQTRGASSVPDFRRDSRPRRGGVRLITLKVYPAHIGARPRWSLRSRHSRPKHSKGNPRSPYHLLPSIGCRWTAACWKYKCGTRPRLPIPQKRHNSGNRVTDLWVINVELTLSGEQPDNNTNNTNNTI